MIDIPSRRDLQGASGRSYCFEHPTPEQLEPGVSFPGVYAMISLYADVLCGVKLVAFSKDLPHVPRMTHAAEVIKWGVTHYVMRPTEDENEAAEIVADLIALYDPVGNRS